MNAMQISLTLVLTQMMKNSLIMTLSAGTQQKEAETQHLVTHSSFPTFLSLLVHGTELLRENGHSIFKFNQGAYYESECRSETSISYAVLQCTLVSERHLCYVFFYFTRLLLQYYSDFSRQIICS